MGCLASIELCFPEWGVAQLCHQCKTKWQGGYRTLFVGVLGPLGKYCRKLDGGTDSFDKIYIAEFPASAPVVYRNPPPMRVSERFHIRTSELSNRRSQFATIRIAIGAQRFKIAPFEPQPQNPFESL